MEETLEQVLAVLSPETVKMKTDPEIRMVKKFLLHLIANGYNVCQSEGKALRKLASYDLDELVATYFGIDYEKVKQEKITLVEIFDRATGIFE